MPCVWGVKAGMDRVWVAGKTVWFVTHGPSLCALTVVLPMIRRHTNNEITYSWLLLLLLLLLLVLVLLCVVVVARCSELGCTRRGRGSSTEEWWFSAVQSSDELWDQLSHVYHRHATTELSQRTLVTSSLHHATEVSLARSLVDIHTGTHGLRTFPGKSLSRKDVSRKIIFPEK